MHTMRLTQKEHDRLHKNSKRLGKCILYGGRTDRDGYGIFHFRKKPRRAHRVAYWAVCGDIPPGMFIDHKCRNRLCINSDHLGVMTPHDNALKNSKSPAAMNSRKTTCPVGHPFDRKYGGQRYCSVCESAKRKRLRAKWRAEDRISC